jgi:MFS family permease
LRLVGSIIANAGFIARFADTTVAGVPALSAKHVQVWGGCGIAALVLGHWIAGYLGDRVGRRASVFSPLTLDRLTYEIQPTMWVFLVIFIVGIIIEMVAKTWQSWLGAKIVMGMVRLVVAISGCN